MRGASESGAADRLTAAQAEFDALVVVSFGGPEGQEEVLPFLRNVVGGRDIPEERLMEVAEHYRLFGGVSPISSQNRALVAALRAALAAAGIDLPVYWGNRNWRPMLADELARMRDDGVQSALALVTSAYGSYSGCRQYLDDIETARSAVGEGAPAVDKLRLFYNHPGFIETWVASLRQELQRARAGGRSPAAQTPPVLFTAHSIPLSMAESSEYVSQLSETARLVAAGAGVPDGGWRLVWQSRSGPPAQPWLAPDIVDAMTELPEDSTVVIAPIGFVSDHMEVVYDLDTVAVAAGSERGQKVLRAATPGTDARFVAMACELVAERLDPSLPRRAVGRFGPYPDRCAPGCCPAPVRRR